MKNSILFLFLLISIITLAQTKPKTQNKKTAPLQKTSALYKVGDKTDTEENGVWYPSQVLKVQGDSFYIHYDNDESIYDLWVKKDRMRKRNTSYLSMQLSTNTGKPEKNSIILSNMCDYDMTLHLVYNGEIEKIIIRRKSSENKTVYVGTKVIENYGAFSPKEHIVEIGTNVIQPFCQFN